MRTISKYLLMMFFCIVILAGESFKINNINICGVVLLIIGFHLLGTILIGRGPKVKLEYLPLFAVAIIFLLVGALKYQGGDVFEDFLPFLVFLIIATSLNELELKDHLQLCRLVIVASALCVLKVLAISYLDVNTSWGGNTFWQAGKHELPSGINRVILKGADVFICVSATLLLSSLMLSRHFPRLFRQSLSVLLLLALLVSVMFSFTRASAAAIVGALFLWGMLLLRTRALDARRILLFAAISALLIALGTDSTFYRAFHDRWSEDEDNLAAGFRQVEALQAIETSSQTGFLGAGFGAHFYTPLSGSAKDDGRSLYVHNMPAWLLLKIGVVGACLFCVVLFRAINSSVKQIKAKHILNIQGGLLLATSLSGLLFLLLNDLINNKFATVSGASAYSLLLSLGKVSFPRNGSARNLGIKE